jgi:hypothetical protein
MPYKAPLSIQVVWHPDFADGQAYAKLIYEAFRRPLDQPLQRGTGIEVFVGKECAAGGGHFAFVILVEENLVTDAAWTPYLQQLQAQIDTAPNRHLLVPVRATDLQLNNPDGIDPLLQQILLYSAPTQIRNDYLIIRLVEVIYRFLNATGGNPAGANPAPPKINLFLSHAKKDGKRFTIQLNEFIRNTFGVATFFDALDIETGYAFDAQLVANASSSALLVVQTDAYSSRPWCRREILTAKSHQCPIVVFNGFNEGEERSFPYMCNVPVYHLAIDFLDPTIPPEKLARVVRVALIGFLKFAYQRNYLSYLNTLFETSLPEACVLPNAPELLTLLPFRDKEGITILYPDPLLGDEETSQLNLLNKSIRFVTPPLLPLLRQGAETLLFAAVPIGISISGTGATENVEMLQANLQDIMVDLARNLLATGARLVYGGGLHEMNGVNFTQLLFDLVNMYNMENAQPAGKVVNYTVFPYAEALDKKKEAELLAVAHIERVPVPAGITVDKARWKEYIKAGDPEKKKVTADLLTTMRQAMNAATKARIFLGGITTGYDGHYPGILEEAVLAMQGAQPVFLVGGYGGCTAWLREQFLHPGAANPSLQQFTARLEPFAVKGWGSLNNQLTADENERLATTRQAAEITQIILTGLARVFK